MKTFTSSLVRDFTPFRWDDDEEYAGSDTWSYRRWAWEFLRRNPAYQAACRTAPRHRGADNSEVAAKFGRLDLRPYWSRYGYGDDQRSMWLAEHVDVVTTLPWSGAPLDKPLREGQVALIFDLVQTSAAGTAALSAMEDRVGMLLRNALKRAEEEGVVQSKLFKPVTKPLLAKYLRLYDAIEYFKVSRDDTVKVLYPQFWDRKAEAIADGARADAHKAISKNLQKARKLVSHEYQTLVPLDVIR